MAEVTLSAADSMAAGRSTQTVPLQKVTHPGSQVITLPKRIPLRWLWHMSLSMRAQSAEHMLV